VILNKLKDLTLARKQQLQVGKLFGVGAAETTREIPVQTKAFLLIPPFLELLKHLEIAIG
jgi:hypothetical protein